MRQYRITKILIGFFLILFFVAILSLLVGAQWIMDFVLYLSDDTLCEDKNKDGVDDFCQYWNNGVLVRLEWDTNFDKLMDVWLKHSEQEEIFLYDSNFDGTVDYKESHTPAGITHVEIDSDFDGIFDRLETIRN